MKHCPNCKNEINQGSRYCSQCGVWLNRDSENDGNAATELGRHPKHKFWFPVLLPIVTVLLIGIALYFTYTYQQRVNQEIVNKKGQGVALALAGNYHKSEKILSEAVRARPDFESLQKELIHVRSILVMDNELAKVSEYIQNNRLKEARDSLSLLKEQLNNKNSRLLETLHSKVDEMESRMTVKKISNDMNHVTSVDELASNLNTLSGLNLKEAAVARDKITEKIVSVSINNAEEALVDKQFAQAIEEVDEGLQYAMNHEKLLQLKERIHQEKKVFENEQKQRMEDAMEQAAEDDLRNMTEALELVDLRIEKDGYGNALVSGEVKSAATQIISTITAKYKILDENDEVVKSDEAKVYPVYLNPGKHGTFEKIYYDLKGEFSIELTDLDWLVE